MDRRDFLAQCAAEATAMAAAPAAGRAEPATDATPQHTSPLAMWALTGTLKSEDVCGQLDQFSAAGWGVVLYPRWGLEIEYLSDAWFGRIGFIVQQAAARAMEVWLYDEFCWPSGQAKGLVVKDHPELAAQLLCVERDGRSRIERLPDAANLLMPEATQRFLAVTHQRYAAAIGPYLGTTVRAIFTDEPSLPMQHHPRPASDKAAWRLPWSEAMDRALGGDFPRRLAEVGEAAKSPLWQDYWAAYARVYHDAWTAPIAQWCRSHKIAMSGHLMGEGAFGSQLYYYGNLRRQLAEFGIPGIDEINTQHDVEKCEAMTLATIAEYPGRERMVEVFALGPCYMSMETMRKMVDLCASCGVDRYVLAICPHDLRGNVFNRKYLGVYGVQQPWFREYAKVFAEYVAEAAARARAAQPLGVPWPAEEELWSDAGPEPRASARLKQMSESFITAAREVIRSRLEPVCRAPSIAKKPLATAWTFAPQGLNSLRLDGSVLRIVDRPSVAELSVQVQLVRGLRINGTAVKLDTAPADRQFDLSYRRVPVAGLLRAGENRIEIDSPEKQPLPFLPALVLWGDFALDGQGRLVRPPASIQLGDWRPQGYRDFCGTGRYRAEVDFDRAPSRLEVDSGGFPVRVMVNGRDCGRRAWAPFRFDVSGAARSGRNEIVVEITSTLGHLFVPRQSPPVGLLGVWTRALWPVS